MTMPHHGRGSRGHGSRPHGLRAGRRAADWSDAVWGWDPSADAAVRQHRRIRRAQRAQRLAQLRADIAAAALRHPSRAQLPGESAA